MYEKGTKIIEKSSWGDISPTYWEIIKIPKEDKVNSPKATLETEDNARFELSCYDEEGKKLPGATVEFFKLKDTIGNEDNEQFEVIDEFPWE